MNDPVRAVQSAAQRAYDRWVLLGEAEVRARACPDDRRDRVVALAKAAEARWDAALGERDAAALVLARSAIPLYLEAVVTNYDDEGRGDDASHSPEPLWDRYEAMAARGLVPPLPTALRSVQHPRELPEAELAECGAARIELTLALGTWLAKRLETRTPRRIRLARRLRQGTLALGLLYLTGLGLARLARPGDLALHAMVTASSQRPGSGLPRELTRGKDPATSSPDFATRDEADPWVTVDLGSAKGVSSVKLVSSAHEDAALPFRVETSLDGLAWSAGVAEASRFGPNDPATLNFPRRSARFVRVHGRPGGALYLREVEVR